MKPKSKSLKSLQFIAFTLAGLSQTVKAADQTFDAANPSDVWDTITENWDASAETWTNDNNAIFTGIGESVSVDDAISVANLTFNSEGFTIAPGTGSLSLAAGASTVTAVPGTSTISTLIDGTGALDKAGNGTR